MVEFVSPYVAFSAPSGAGKTTIVKKLVEKYPEQLVISVSATTRPMRPGERDGVDYYFMTEEEFKQAIKQGRFLEWELVHGNYYGTLLEKIQGHTEQGKTVLFDIDVKGAQSVKRNFPEAILIFIKPPSKEELIRRLKMRRSEDEATIRKRLERLEFEYEQARFFDHIVINDRLEDAVRQVERIIIKNKA
ncbi:MAG TPA: guanylate kinase [Caldithrix abyssi]|uniref:Guanylate kinase n=1 Tax=Caldithrix abyssi TaxID=187145 RepID=A0A7V5PNR3_CALAY|nr:guanylate kinase [Caldithrix abyssi]